LMDGLAYSGNRGANEGAGDKGKCAFARQLDLCFAGTGLLGKGLLVASLFVSSFVGIGFFGSTLISIAFAGCLFGFLYFSLFLFGSWFIARCRRGVGLGIGNSNWRRLAFGKGIKGGAG